MTNTLRQCIFTESTPCQTVLTRENFKGCIRNVKLNSGSNGMGIVDWTDMDQLHNILLNECPAGRWDDAKLLMKRTKPLTGCQVNLTLMCKKYPNVFRLNKWNRKNKLLWRANESFRELGRLLRNIYLEKGNNRCHNSEMFFHCNSEQSKISVSVKRLIKLLSWNWNSEIVFIVDSFEERCVFQFRREATVGTCRCVHSFIACVCLRTFRLSYPINEKCTHRFHLDCINVRHESHCSSYSGGLLRHCSAVVLR